METYKTSFISFLGNYLLCILVILFLFILSTQLNLTFTLNPETTQQLISTLAILGSLILLIILLEEPFLERVTKVYFVTDKEIIKEEGIIRKKKVCIPVQNVADVKMEKGILGRMFNFGDVIVAGMKDTIKIKGVKSPENVYNLIKSKVSK
jgi:membrane protein YdbS with pleckstrin-like domain